MEWIESSINFVSQINPWVLGGIAVTVLAIVGQYSSRLMAWLIVLGLLLAHHDFWNWTSPSRSIGHLPAEFVYHVGLTLVTAVAWWIITLEAWPKDPFENADTTDNHNVPPTDGGVA